MIPNPTPWRTILPLLLLIPAVAGRAGPPPAKIEWQASYQEAVERAAEENRVVFVAFDHAGEARCDHFLDKLTRDKEIAALAELTLNVPVSVETHKKSGSCPRFKGTTCADHRRSEAALRETLVPANAKGVVAIPQYLWIDGQGKVLYSVPFELDREGFVWCFHAALRRVDPEPAPPFPEEIRPPRRLLVGEAYRPGPNDEFGRGLTEDELESLFKAIKSSIFGMANTTAMVRVLFTDEPDAVDYARVELAGAVQLFASNSLPRTIHTIGAISPPAFWEALAEFEKHRNPEIRIEVAVALEQMAAEKGLRIVKRALAREKEERVRNVWIRALAACGGAEASVRKKVLASFKDEEDERLCANAAIALGYLAPHPDVRERLVALLSSLSADVRVAAACAMALTFDAQYLEVLEPAHERCAEGVEKEALARALESLRSGGLAAIEEDVARVTGSFVARERIFFRSRTVETGEGGEAGGEGG